MSSETLPPNWSWVKLGDIGQIVTGTTPPKNNLKNYGDYVPLYKPSDLNIGTNILFAKDNLSKVGIENARLLPEGSILVTSIGATIGKTGLIKRAGASNQQINAIIPGPNFISEFIYYFCISPNFQKQILKNASSTTLPIINKSKFEKLTIPLPPLPEQKKIVEKIEELFSGLDNGVASLKKAKEQIRLYRQSVLASAFSGKLVFLHSIDNVRSLIFEIKQDKENHYKKECAKANNEGRHKPNKIVFPEMIVNHSLYDLPDNWIWETIFMTSNYDGNAIVDGPFGSNLKTSDYDSNGNTPVITISNIEDGFKNLRFINDEKYDEVKRSTVYPGDIIVAKIGSSYGKVGYYPINMLKGIIPANLLKVSVSERFNKQFLYYYLKSYYFKKHLDLITKYTAQPAFNVSKFKALPIPIPSRKEQDQIVEEIEKRFSEADNLEKAIDDSLEKSETLRQSILKQAFEGKLV